MLFQEEEGLENSRVVRDFCHIGPVLGHTASVWNALHSNVARLVVFRRADADPRSGGRR